MEASREIENLLYRYAESLDAGDFEAVGGLFAEASYGVAGGPGVRGAEAVTRLLRGGVKLYEDGTPRTKHLTTNAIVEVDEAAGRATARSYYTVFQQVPGAAPCPIVLGRYHDGFARTAGRWHFSERGIFIDLMGDLSHHLRRPGITDAGTR